MSEPNDQWSWDGVHQAPGNVAPGNVPPGAGAYQQPAWQGGQSYGQQLAMGGGSPSPWGTFTYRPGIIPLRPLTFGEFFDGAFRSIQHNPQVMFGLSLLVAVVLGVLEAIIFGPALGDLLAFDPETSAVPVGELGILMAGSLVTGVVGLVATIVLNGLLVTSVSQSVLGRRVSIGAVWTQSRGQLWRLVGLSLLLTLIQVAVITAAVVLVVLLISGAAALGTDSVWVVLLLSLLVVIGAGVLIGFFYVKLALSSPVLMVERARIGNALARSWSLTQGYFWRNLGVIAVASIVTGAISGVASMPIGMVTSALMALGPQFIWFAGALSVLLAALLNALVTPFLAAVTALLYVDIRMRKEGLDVELIRAVGDSL